MTSKTGQRNQSRAPGERHVTHVGTATLEVRSMGEVAAILGVSRQAVHQVERTALHKLRVAFADELAERNPRLHASIAARITTKGL